jgi:hypothetical protein
MTNAPITAELIFKIDAAIDLEAVIANLNDAIASGTVSVTLVVGGETITATVTELATAIAAATGYDFAMGSGSGSGSVDDGFAVGTTDYSTTGPSFFLSHAFASGCLCTLRQHLVCLCICMFGWSLFGLLWSSVVFCGLFCGWMHMQHLSATSSRRICMFRSPLCVAEVYRRMVSSFNTFHVSLRVCLFRTFIYMLPFHLVP